VAKHVAVSVTEAGRDAIRGLVIAATTAVQAKVNMSDAIVAALAVIRDHPAEFCSALLKTPDLVIRTPDVPEGDPARLIARAVSADGRTADFHLAHSVRTGEVLHHETDSYTVTSIREIEVS
jgi:hypothetical protein